MQQNLRVMGFTLIELLIVIGILSILTTIVVMIINPVDLLKQSRDITRISDLVTLNKAIQLYTANGQSSFSMGSANTVYVSVPAVNTDCSDLNLPSLPSGSYSCSNSTNYRNINGTGWIPIDFSSFALGSPLATLPVDPVNATSTRLYYTYIPGGSFELASSFESDKYKMGGLGDKASLDGGQYPDLYEVGTDLTLLPIDYGDSSLVGYWKLDGGTSGSIANNTTAGLQDSSGKNNNGTAKNSNGTGMAWTTGKQSGAVSFDGVDDYVQVPTNVSLNPASITVIVWVNPSDTSGHRRVVNKNGSTGYMVNIYAGGFETYVGGQNVGGGGSVSTGQYTQLALTVGNGQVKLYKNSVLTKTATLTGTMDGSTAVLTIASNSPPVDSLFVGYIDDVRVYNRALSGAEIQAIYSSAK